MANCNCLSDAGHVVYTQGMLIMSLRTEFFIEVMSTRGFALIILSNFHKTLLITHLALRELNVAFSTAMLEEMVALDPFQ